MITFTLNKTEVKNFMKALENWGDFKVKVKKSLLLKFEKIQFGPGGKIGLTDQDLQLLLKIAELAGSKVRKIIKPKKNPLAGRTKALRASGAIKPQEWIGGNEFHQVKPAVNKFLEREKHGQLRMQLNPKKKKPKAKKPAKAKKKSLP